MGHQISSKLYGVVKFNKFHEFYRNGDLKFTKVGTSKNIRNEVIKREPSILEDVENTYIFAKELKFRDLINL